ncbi:uncharacterized protein LOC126291683 isoform X18 [Schistocerca gregaria]|uniref:uncharacterized protein LOC126291683 isoform X18 n=1 Tax=Schistocerca gregaria TaxID=7010 RepID=UPI00211E2FD1|nr:uncharacterized protein LOC126291683 isoform X18 [Schistocerca gregaria]
MSNFSANGLNAWRLTRRESRLFPPDSLKFHSFVVETGSKLRCGRKDSPQARKGRRSAGEESAARQLTYCCCHVENSDITSAVKFRLGSPTCVPDCGCCLEETCDETVGSAAFVPEKDCQVRQIRCAMKRRASSDPRPRKVAKVSVRHLAVTNKRNSVNTKGITQLQPSVIKDSDVAISSNSLSYQPRNQKIGKGKLSAERLSLFWNPSVHLQRLPAEIVKCYLSRPTVVLSRLPDSLFQCQQVSSKKVPVTAASAPEKRLNADSKLKDQERKKLKRNDLSTLDRVKTRNTEAVNTDSNTKSAKEGAPVTSGSESQTRSKSEPRPEDLEKQKKSNSGLRTVDKFKSSSTNTIHANVNTKSAQKVEVPVILGRESRTRSKSDLRRDELEKRKRSSSSLRTEDKVRSRSANSVHADVNMNSAQKVTRQAVANQNALSPVRNLCSNSPKKPERKMYRNAGEVVNAEVKDVHSKSTRAGTHKAEEQTKWRRSKSAEAIFNGAQNGVKSNLGRVAADKLEEQVLCHPVTRHSTSSASSLSNSLRPKSPSKTDGLSVEERNYFPQLKVTRLLELTNNNRSAGTIDELVQEMCSPTSANMPPKKSEITPEEKPLKRNVRRPRRDETGGGLPVESPEDCKEDGVKNGDKNPALEIRSPASAGTPQKDSETALEEKSLKRKRGRQRRDETGSGPSVEKSEDHRHDGVTSRDKNDSALEIHSPALVDTPHKDSETTLEEKSLKRRRGRQRRDETVSGPSVEKSEHHKHDGVAGGDKNAALERAPVTATNVPEKYFKIHSKPEYLERKKKRNDLSTMDQVKLCNMEAVNGDSSNKSAEEVHSQPSQESSESTSKLEDVGRRKRQSSDNKAAIATVMSRVEDSIRSKVRAGDKKHTQERPPVTSASVQGKRFKADQVPEDLERKKKRRNNQSTMDQSKSHDTEVVNADSNKKSTREEAPVTAANKYRHRSKSETRPEELEKRTKSSSGLKTVDKQKSSPAESVNANDNRNSAQKEAPVTAASKSRHRSKSETRPEELEKRTRSSSDLKTMDKEKSSPAESVNADDNRNSAQKETPVTSVRGSRRRSKSEPRAEVVEKRKRSSSGLRTEGKASSASGNSFNANVNRTPTQKGTPVASVSEPRRRSKSEPRLEGLENRKGSSSDQMTEEKIRSPSKNSVNADINRKAVQKETSATSGSESRPHSKSEVIPEALERRNTQISDLATPDKVKSTIRDLVNGDINRKSVQKETSATSGHDSRQHSKSEMRPETLERRSTYISDLAIPYKVKSTNRHMVNGDINRSSVEKQSPGTSRNSSQIHSELESREERQKKRLEKSNECRAQITMMNGGEENFSIPVVGANENPTQEILPKAAAHADMSVLSNNKHHYPDQASKLLNKIPTKLERLKAKICQNTSVNKLQDVTSNFLYGGDSNVRTRQKMLESLAPSPSCRSVRSMLSESRTSLNSLSSEGTEFESPAYEPLGSSPIFMQNLRDEHEEIQKTKVISPSCRSDCCSLRQPQELTSPPLKIQMQNKTAVRRLSDEFDAVPSTSKGTAAHRKMAEEQRLKCLVAAEDDGNVVPCHEVDASFYEEWTKRVREADRKAEAGFAPKYSKKYKGRKETFDEMPTPSDDGKELILSQKLSSTSPTNCKQHNVVPNKLALLGWKDLHSPSNCVPSNESPATRPLNTSDGGTNDSEEDCIITDVRLCSSPSSVLHKTPPLGIRKNSSTSTTLTGQRNLGKSLTDIRPEQQIGESNELTVIGVSRTSSPRKRQQCNKSQFQSSAFSACHCRSKRVQRRCRSASPRLCSVNDYYRTEDDDDEDDDDDYDDDKYDFDPVTRLQQINKQIELLENSTPQVNPLWRRKTRNRASLLEGNGVNKVKSDGYREDSEDDDKSVIIVAERNPCFSPRSPSYTPPDLRAKRSSTEQCGSLTVENVAKHNNFLKNSISGPSSSSSLSLCGLSDSDDDASVCCVSRGMVTPRKGPDREPSFTEASTPRTNGVSPCLSPTTKSRSRCSSRNEDNSMTDLPTCSATKTHTVIGQRNGAEMLHLFASPASCVTDEVSPVLNKRRNPPFKGSVNSAKHNGLLDSVSKDPDVSLRGHSSQLVTPSLSAARMATVFCHRSDGVQEIEDTLSQENDINSMNEKESVRRNLKTPTELHVRRLSSLSPMETCYGPPSSPGEQSSECSMERRMSLSQHSVSSMEKSMLLHLFDEIRTMPQLEKGIERDEEEDSVSAGNVSICVDGSQSSGESDDLDAERRDTDAEVVAEGFGLQITRGDLATLSGTNWLNDKIVNFYLKLLTERGRQNREPEVYAYDTFFFPKLIKCGYESVKKWTRVVDVFKHDILIIPVHLGTHWCMAAVDFRKQTLVYYDSMGGENESCLKTIWNYLNEECAQRSVEPLSEEIWQIRCAKDIPKQSNNSDCGVFMCKYAECITRDAKLEFSQSDMPEIRMEMMEEIQTMTLLHP